jgi:DEAD/DEAH box helicase domain-containing protein
LLPSVVATELEQVASDAIRTAFHPATPGFRRLIDRLLQQRLAQVACLVHAKPALVR